MATSKQSRRKWKLLASLIAVGWLLIAAIAGPFFGRISEVTSNDPTAYLPQSADATQVQKTLPAFFETDGVPALLVFVSEEPLTSEQISAVGQSLETVASVPGVIGGISPAIPSADGMALQSFLTISATEDISSVVETINSELSESNLLGVQSYLTGPAGFAADLSGAFAGIDGILLLVTVVAVFLILLFVYRSLLLPVIVLLTSIFALCAALFTVWQLANQDILLINGQTQGILFILVIGAATDYSILYVARLKEELQKTESVLVASKSA